MFHQSCRFQGQIALNPGEFPAVKLTALKEKWERDKKWERKNYSNWKFFKKKKDEKFSLFEQKKKRFSNALSYNPCFKWQ